MVFNQGDCQTKRWIGWPEIGFDAHDALYVRDLWTHETSGPQRGGVFVTVPPDDVAMLRVSRKNEFLIPPVLAADTYAVTLRADNKRLEKLSGTVTVTNKGSADLPPWRIGEGLPSWLSVTVTGDGKNQRFVNTVSTAGLKQGFYHAVVSADTMGPVSGRPVSALYCDVDLEIIEDVGPDSK
jgi:hypothetical protein